MTENSLFLPRYQTSAVTLVLQAFQLGHGEEVSVETAIRNVFSKFIFCNLIFAVSCAPQVYIHCKLVAWDPDALDETNKACHYKKESMR